MRSPIRMARNRADELRAPLRTGASNRTRSRGFALILTIWAIGLIALLALPYITSARLRLQAGGNIAAAAKAELLAEAAVNLALLTLVGNSGDATKDMRFDGAPTFCRLREDAIAAVSIESEAGKLDINAASPALIAKTLAGLGAARDEAATLAAAILSYRSARANALSIEDGEYHAAGRPFGPRKALFLSALEIDQVIGVSPELAARLQPFLTVHGFLPEPDLATSPPALFAARTNATAAEVDRLIERPFPNDLDRRAWPRRLAGVTAILIRAETRTRQGASFVREALVGRLSGGTGDVAFQVIEWRTGASRFRDELQERSNGGLTANLPPCG